MATRDELIAEVERLNREDDAGIVVTRTDGKDGDPRVSDFEHALAVYHGVIIEEPDWPQAKTYEVSGPFAVLGVGSGDTFEAELHEDGSITTADGGRANADALLAQGAITEIEREGS